jgi:hypothetical protein
LCSMSLRRKLWLVEAAHMVASPVMGEMGARPQPHLIVLCQPMVKLMQTGLATRRDLHQRLLSVGASAILKLAGSYRNFLMRRIFSTWLFDSRTMTARLRTLKSNLLIEVGLFWPRGMARPMALLVRLDHRMAH